MNMEQISYTKFTILFVIFQYFFIIFPIYFCFFDLFVVYFHKSCYTFTNMNHGEVIYNGI